MCHKMHHQKYATNIKLIINGFPDKIIFSQEFPTAVKFPDISRFSRQTVTQSYNLPARFLLFILCHLERHSTIR